MVGSVKYFGTHIVLLRDSADEIHQNSTISGALFTPKGFGVFSMGR